MIDDQSDGEQSIRYIWNKEDIRQLVDQLQRRRVGLEWSGTQMGHERMTFQTRSLLVYEITIW